MKNLIVILSFILFILFGENVNCQIISNPLRYYNPLPSSPNVATLGKFGDIPVGTFTGIPNIEIPLYTIKIRDFELPLTLKYHSSGIKVAEEASFVGLGWALEAGGVISQVVNDRNDLGIGGDNGYKGLNSIPDPASSSGYSPYTGSYCPISTYYPNVDIAMDARTIPYCHVQQISSGEWGENSYDTEPDLFYYNIGNYTGKFFWHKESNSFQTLSRQKIQIDYLGANEGWKMVTPEGVIYNFTQKEYYSSCSSAVGNPPSESSGPSYYFYYLTSIQFPTGEDVTLNYQQIEEDRICNLAQISQSFDNPRPYPYSTADGHYVCGFNYYGIPIYCDLPSNYFGLHTTVTKSYYYPVYIQNIHTPDAVIDFQWDSREDQPTGRRLVKILINNINSQTVKTIEFDNNHYFTGHITDPTNQHGYGYGDCEVGNNSCNGISPDYDKVKKWRLKLNALTISDQINPYIFNYDESHSLPAKVAYGIDMWGYYNGKDYNTSLLPNLNYGFQEVTDPPDGYSPQDRRANDYAKTWTLNRITYPTGGYTIFEYELNTFGNYSYPDHTGQDIKFSFGGGLRVSKVIDYENNSLLKERTYKYEYSIDENGIPVYYSYGKIMDPPRFYRKFKIYEWEYNVNHVGCDNDNTYYENRVVYGSPANGLTTTYQGNYVGYSKVIEIIGSELSNTGQIEYTFNVDPFNCNINSIAPCGPSIYHGQPSSIVHKDVDGNKIKETIFDYYAQTDLIETYGIKPELASYGACPATYNIHSYPIQGSRIEMKSKIENWYEQTNQANHLEKSTTYKYDLNGYLVKESTINSDGSVQHIFKSFPLQYTGSSAPWINNLVTHHLLNFPIETVEVKERNGSFSILDGTINQYTDNSTGLIDKIFKAENQNAIPLSEFKFSWVANSGTLPELNSIANFQPDDKYNGNLKYEYAYDAIHKNVIQTTLNQQIITSYFWDNNGLNPIIKGENIETADLTQVVNSSTTDLPGLLNTIGDMTTEMQKTIWKNFNTALRSNSLAANALITTYTYKPLVGITSSTDPAGIATYYEYDPFGRLSIIRDDKNNIIKKYDYHYAGQEEKK